MPVSPRAGELLAAVHAAPGVTRAVAAQRVGIGTGAAAEAVAQLTAAGLVCEQPAERTGGRGRPTTVLLPHPDGPLVLALSLTQERWKLRATQLGGEAVADAEGAFDDLDGPAALAEVARAVTRLRRRFGPRVRGICVAAPGTVVGTRVGHATGASWRDLDLTTVWRTAPAFAAGNDATLAGAAEASRGAAAGAGLSVHVRVLAGIGGAVVDGGRVLTGAHGLGGEFGHMPFGDPQVRCACGARGCWGTSVDGAALARLLGRREPRDPVAFTARVAAARDEASQRAVAAIATALGRGLAGLANALDPEVLTVGGTGADILAAQPDAVHDAYVDGLMTDHRADPPRVVPAALGEDGPLVGAAEQAWQAVWTQL
ncbi:ROK family protein [Jatrophihabitans fulvus]